MITTIIRITAFFPNGIEIYVLGLLGATIIGPGGGGIYTGGGGLYGLGGTYNGGGGLGGGSGWIYVLGGGINLVVGITIPGCLIIPAIQQYDYI